MPDPWTPVSSTPATWISASAALLVTEDYAFNICTEDGMYNIAIDGFQQTIWTPVS